MICAVSLGLFDWLCLGLIVGVVVCCGSCLVGLVTWLFYGCSSLIVVVLVFGVLFLVRELVCCVLDFRCFGSWIGFAGLVCCC